MLNALRNFFNTRIGEFQQRYQRIVPFGDTIVDRWEKARLAGFGENTSVYDSSLILGDVWVGHDTWIGPNTVLDGSGGLTIGSHCSVSAGVQIYSHDTVARSLSGGSAPIEKAGVCIGDNCYIGPNAIISKGVTIGNNVVIGAQSLVRTDVPDNCVAFGIPATIKGSSERYWQSEKA